MEYTRAFAFRFTESDLDGLRRVAEHMVATGRLIRPEKSDAVRFLIRDYVLSNCPVEETHPTSDSQQAA
jgi:hypothetical protein